MLNRLLLPVLAVTALGLSACGSDDDASSTTPAAVATTPEALTSSAAFDAASGEVTIKATEFAFSPSIITAPAGKLKITMENDGRAVHELVVLKTDATPGSLKVTDGRVDEADSVGEISETQAGKSKSHTFDLKPGKYVIVCNVNGHYMKGMYGELVIS